jgi:hypothetical protein
MPVLFRYAPPLVWAAACGLLAVIYYLSWPRARAQGRTRGLRYIVLRWFHSLVWVLLGVALALYELPPGAPRSVAKVLAVAALGAYISFVVAAYAPRARANDAAPE